MNWIVVGKKIIVIHVVFWMQLSLFNYIFRNTDLNYIKLNVLNYCENII